MNGMDEQVVKQFQKHARIMGILYGVIIQCELKGVPVTLSTITETMKQHCSQEQLRSTMEEVQRYASIITDIQTK